jgi:hypothetical protein
MSHLDGESDAAAFAAGLAESWAPRARGINATHAKARKPVTHLERREYMRNSSAIELNYMIKAVCEHNLCSGRLGPSRMKDLRVSPQHY